MAKREFHISDILSISSGRLVSNRHMDGIYDILDFMTGVSLFTHQLPRAMHACRPQLLQKYPILNNVNIDELETLIAHADNPEAACAYWVQHECLRHGIPEMLSVETIPEKAYTRRDPIQEAIEMRTR